MSDFLSAQPVASIGMAVRPTPPAPQPRIAPAAAGGSPRSAADHDQPRTAQGQVSVAREFAARRRFDENTLTGPPPAFQASLLEVERSLDTAIARLTEARKAVAVTPVAPSDAGFGDLTGGAIGSGETTPPSA